MRLPRGFFLFYRARVKAAQVRKKKKKKKEVEFVHLLKANFYQMMFAVYLLFSDSQMHQSTRRHFLTFTGSVVQKPKKKSLH